jgi:soluble lytic murein transglycosylase-like protein
VTRSRLPAFVRATPEVAIVSTRPTPASPIPDFERHIVDAAREHGVREELIRAIIQTESEFDPRAVSQRGACGLMQLMPRTARSLGVVDCFDARENIQAGTRHLKFLLRRYRGSVSMSIAAYNAGEGAVARHRGIPPYGQTQAYVRKVIALL